MRHEWKYLVLSALTGALGCNTPAEEPAHEEPAQALGQVDQGLRTTTYTLSWPSNTATTGDLCRFGDTTQGHQVATNTRASGRLEETLTITGLAGRRITSIRLNGSSSQFKYDDVMLLAYNNHLVMASDRRVAEYSASPAALGTSPVLYSWSKIRNGLIDNQNVQSAWCTSGAINCKVPRTETTGSMDVDIPNFLAVDEAAYPTAPDTRTFRLVTIGDDDPSLDCRHGPITLSVTVQHAPTSCIQQPPASVVQNHCPGNVATTLSYGTDCGSGTTVASSILVPAGAARSGVAYAGIYFRNDGAQPLTFVNSSNGLGSWSVGGQGLYRGMWQSLNIQPAGSTVRFNDLTWGSTFDPQTAHLGCIAFDTLSLLSPATDGFVPLDVSYTSDRNQDGVPELYTSRVKVYFK